jgi:DNA-binding transcriptional ArsR family regulator
VNDIGALAALADPTRRALFERIVEAPRSVGELAAMVPVTQPAVSQHLKVLRSAQLVEVEQRGAQRIYRARREGLDDLRRLVNSWINACP